MNCKNCGLRVEGNFCSHCGQKASIGRITVANFLHEVSESIFQINRGFFYTLGELFVRPGKSIDEFLQGKRKRHFKPIAYLIALSTAYFLTTQITGQNTWVGDIITGWMNHATEQDANADLPEVATWFLTNYAYATLLLLPVFSLASYLSFFPFGKTDQLVYHRATGDFLYVVYRRQYGDRQLYCGGVTVVYSHRLYLLGVLAAFPAR